MQIQRVIILSIILILSLAVNTNAQKVLTLDESLRIALNESYDIKSEQYQLEQTQFSLKMQQAMQRTQITSRLTAPTWSKDNVADQVGNQVQYFFQDKIRTLGDINISQPIIFTDGTFSINGNYSTQDATFENEIGINTAQTWGSGLFVQYDQPLFQPNQQKMNLDAKKRGLTRSENSYEFRQNMIYVNVIRAYYNLVQNKRQMEIEEENVEQLELTKDNTMNKFRAGIMAEVQALQTQVDLDEGRNNYAASQLSYQSALDDFKLLIGIPLDEVIDVATIEATISVVEVNDEKAIEEALKNSMRIKNARLSLQDERNNLRTVKNRGRINASLRLNYGISENDPMSGKKLSDYWFQDMSRSNGVELQFTVPIFDSGVSSNNVQVSEIGLKSSELDIDNNMLLIKKDVKNAVNNVRSAQSRMEILAQTEQLAERSYAITLERYDIGEIDSESLFLDNQRLKNTKLRVLQAKIDYLVALATLYQLTYWDFERDQPLNKTIESILN